MLHFCVDEKFDHVDGIHIAGDTLMLLHELVSTAGTGLEKILINLLHASFVCWKFPEPTGEIILKDAIKGLDWFTDAVGWELKFSTDNSKERERIQRNGNIACNTQKEEEQQAQTYQDQLTSQQ